MYSGNSRIGRSALAGSWTQARKRSSLSRNSSSSWGTVRCSQRASAVSSAGSAIGAFAGSFSDKGS